MPGLETVFQIGIPEGTYGPHWNRWEKGAQQDMLKHFLSSNESNDRKPFDYQHLFQEAVLKALAEKMVASVIQPTQSRISFPFSLMSSMQSPMGNYSVNPAANLQIFGFRGYVCEKCLTPETHYVAFPNAEGDGYIQGGHYCVPANAATASGLVDRSRVFRSLQDKLPTLIKQKVNSRNGNNNHLVALRLSRHPEETIKFQNPDLSKPPIAFTYSKERHLSLEAIEGKKKCDYLRKAITLGTTPLSDEELTDFLEIMRNATFGVVHKNSDHEDNSSHGSSSYFVYIN
jgi:hypothetical protein